MIFFFKILVSNFHVKYSFFGTRVKEGKKLRNPQTRCEDDPMVEPLKSPKSQGCIWGFRGKGKGGF